MSKEFEKIKNEVNDFRQAAENKIESEKRAVDERMKKGKLILEKSGAISLFEEIRDSRLVMMGTTSREKVWVNKSFGRGYYEEKIEHDLARVELSRFKNVHQIAAVASLALVFNKHDGGNSYRYDEIRVAVVGEELCLVEGECRMERRGSELVYVDYTYTPIRQGELATTIAKALKNPTKDKLSNNYENL